MKSSAAVSSHLRRNATYEDCCAILECLRPAFAPYRESYTPEAFLDTVLTPETLAIRGGLPCGEGALRHPPKPCKRWFRRLRRTCPLQPRPTSPIGGGKGSGVSTCLLERAEDELRKAGCGIVTLDTTEPLNRASRFYERNVGFGALGKLDASLGCRYLNTANPSVHEPGYQNNLMQVLEPEHRING